MDERDVLSFNVGWNGFGGLGSRSYHVISTGKCGTVAARTCWKIYGHIGHFDPQSIDPGLGLDVARLAFWIHAGIKSDWEPPDRKSHYADWV